MNVRENRRGKKETGNTGYSKTQNEEKQNKKTTQKKDKICNVDPENK